MKFAPAIALLLLLPATLPAKKTGGIYMTAADYKSNKLSYTEGQRIHLNHSAFYLPYITVFEDGRKRRLMKATVYGYKAWDGTVYRFYNKDEYRIAETGPLYIYAEATKIALSKGFSIRINLYFSTSADGAIRPLTKENLREAFPKNERFSDLLDQYFSNVAITSYDDIHKTYKVNYVYRKTPSN